MRIGVLALMAGRSAGGPDTYEVELVRALARRNDGHEYVVYCTTSSSIDAIGVESPRVTYRLMRGPRPWTLTARLPRLLARDGIDVLHSTFAPPPFKRTAEVLTVHCLSSMTHPEFYSTLVAWRLNRLLSAGIGRADRIVCVSETTRTEVRERFGIGGALVRVAHNAVASAFAPVPGDAARRAVRERLRIDGPYMLFLGKLEPRKNVSRLIDAFARFLHHTGSSTRLVLAGNRTGVTPDLDAQIARLGVGHAVVCPGYVPSDLLPSLYAGAEFFVFPSLWEGFGIPILEAMASGTPVVASNVGSLPEIAGDAAVIVDPVSVESIADGMIALERSPDLRQSLAVRGLARSRLFSWDRSAEATTQAYDEAARVFGERRRMSRSPTTAPEGFNPAADPVAPQTARSESEGVRS